MRAKRRAPPGFFLTILIFLALAQTAGKASAQPARGLDSIAASEPGMYIIAGSAMVAAGLAGRVRRK